MSKRYGALEIISGIYKIMGVLVTALGSIVGGLNLVTPSINYVGGNFVSGPPAINAAIGLIVGSIVAGLSLFAFGQLITLLIDLEANTRKTAELLSNAAPKKSTQDVPQLKRLGPRDAP